MHALAAGKYLGACKAKVQAWVFIAQDFCLVQDNCCLQIPGLAQGRACPSGTPCQQSGQYALQLPTGI